MPERKQRFRSRKLCTARLPKWKPSSVTERKRKEASCIQALYKFCTLFKKPLTLRSWESSFIQNSLETSIIGEVNSSEAKILSMINVTTSSSSQNDITTTGPLTIALLIVC